PWSCRPPPLLPHEVEERHLAPLLLVWGVLSGPRTARSDGLVLGAAVEPVVACSALLGALLRDLVHDAPVARLERERLLNRGVQVALDLAQRFGQLAALERGLNRAVLGGHVLMPHRLGVPADVVDEPLEVVEDAPELAGERLHQLRAAQHLAAPGVAHWVVLSGWSAGRGRWPRPRPRRARSRLGRLVASGRWSPVATRSWSAVAAAAGVVMVGVATGRSGVWSRCGRGVRPVGCGRDRWWSRQGVAPVAWSRPGRSWSCTAIMAVTR